MSKKRQRSNKKNNFRSSDQTLIYTLNKAKQLYTDDQVDEALEVLSKIEAQHPFNADISYEIAVYSLQKSSSKGIQKLKSILKRFPDHAKSLLKLGDLYLRPGHIEKASPYLTKAMELYPNLPASHIGMGALEQRKGNLPVAVQHYRQALELQLLHPTTDEEPKPKEDFRVTEAEDLLWETLELMSNNGLHAFMAFGSLLGIQRNGGLLLHDKDVDIGIPHAEMNRALRFLKHHGWQEINNSFGYFSPRAVVHTKTGFSMDLFSFMVNKEKKSTFCVGAGILGTPKEWNIIWEFDSIELEKRHIPNSKKQVWYLKDPKSWLDKIYGDWHTPDKNFDTMVSAKNLQSFSLLSKCFTYSRIFNNWLNNNIPRTLSLTRTAFNHEPNDVLIKRILTCLENHHKSH